MTREPTELDHLVLAAPSLEEGVRVAEELLGAHTVPGGAHRGIGTRNHLLSLGGGTYLEVIGPDPDQPEPDGPRPFGIDDLNGPRLVTWCARTGDLEGVLNAARGVSLDLGEIRGLSRRTPEGTLLEWRNTDPFKERAAGVVPFFIDWRGSVHPTSSLPGGCGLERLRLVHPDSERLGPALEALGLRVGQAGDPVTGPVVEMVEGPEPGLTAWIRTPRGDLVTLS